MKKKVLIIGNGFDICLGWKTSYKDFLDSDFSPLHYGNASCNMEEYLNEKAYNDRWYDLECILREYASAARGAEETQPRDKIFFDKLRDSLSSFIRHQAQSKIDINSLSVQVLREIIHNGYYKSIYSFNYTDLYDIAERAEIYTRFDYRHVHGCVANNSIILGVDDSSELRKGYSYLRKVFSEYYKSNPIRYDLQECDEVTFFGHSLGDMDYPYFKDFFFTQSNCANRNDKKRITIFTKDNASRLQILEQLREMNGGQTERLQNDNDFSLIMTENPDSAALKNYFDHLRKDSVKTHNEHLDSLSSYF